MTTASPLALAFGHVSAGSSQHEIDDDMSDDEQDMLSHRFETSILQRGIRGITYTDTQYADTMHRITTRGGPP